MGKKKPKKPAPPPAAAAAAAAPVAPSSSGDRAASGWLLALIAVVFFVSGLFLVKDYGMNPDSQKNFQEGKLNLDYVLGGPVDQELLQWQMHGSLVFMVADASRRVLSDGLHLYDPVAARHAILPVLVSLFTIPLFLFVGRRRGSASGLLTVALLLTFPPFWGHAFNNLKDVPLLVFYSTAIMAFVEWRLTGKLRYAYAFFMAWGLALCVKTYAVFVPVVLLAWTVLRRDEPGPAQTPSARALLPHALAGAALAGGLVLLCYSPAFWGVKDKLAFLSFWHDRVKEITWGRSNPANIIPFVQVWYRTPVVMLFFAATGFLVALKELRRDPFHPLLMVWCLIPLLIPCLPHTVVYHNEIRLFFVFVVPYCILAMVGLTRAASWIAASSGFAEPAVVLVLALLTVGLNLHGVVSTYPYQATFYNALAGGLKGAQEKDLPDACDYWLNSYKEAGRWLDAHGASGANVVGLYYSGTPSRFNTDLIRESVRRPDLKTFQLRGLPLRQGRIDLPENTYVIAVPFPYLRQVRRWLELSPEFRPVYRISRQGGEVCTIFYKGVGGLSGPGAGGSETGFARR